MTLKTATKIALGCAVAELLAEVLRFPLIERPLYDFFLRNELRSMIEMMGWFRALSGLALRGALVAFFYTLYSKQQN